MKKCMRLFLFFILSLARFGYALETFDSTITVLDLRDYQAETTRSQFLSDLKSALEDHGFFALSHSGVSAELLDEAYGAAREFFSLDHETKREIYDPWNNGQRGYIPGESAKGQIKGDHKEFLHIGRELTEDQQNRLGYSANVWPTSMDLKGPLLRLYAALEEQLLPLQQALSEALEQPNDFISSMTREGDCVLRAIHYPPSPKDGVVWAAEHTDIDLFTILPRATSGGLQVKNQAGEWINVLVPDGAFIVNAGDMIENMSNGYFRSGIHRVISTNDQDERYSMVFFIHPRSDDKMDPLPEWLAKANGVQKYATATRWELLEERLVDLGLASFSMRQHLASCGLMERLIEVGRASPKAMLQIYRDGLASPLVILELMRLKLLP